MSKEKIVQSMCRHCGGTGVYRGCNEPKGVGVVCLYCRGTGRLEIKYTPFSFRKVRDDVQFIRQSRGCILLFADDGVSSEIIKLNQVSYKDFLAGKMPGDI